VSLVTTFLTPSQVAEVVGVSARTVKRWCLNGDISTEAKLGGQRGAYLIGPTGVARAHELAKATTERVA